LWAKSKENPKILLSWKKEGLKLYNSCIHHDRLISILDKDVIYKEWEEQFNTIIKNDGFLKDSIVIEYFKENLDNFSKDQIDSLLDVVVFFLSQDKKISKHEKECLSIFCNNFSCNDVTLKNFDSIKNSTKLKHQHQVKDSTLKTKNSQYAKLFSFTIGLVLIFFTCYGGFIYYKSQRNFKNFNLIEIIDQKPKLVFKKATFNKYVITGKPKGVNSHFEELNIFLLKGTADFQFDTSKLSLNPDKTDTMSKHLCLQYDGNSIPMEIDVNIPPGQVFECMKLEATPLSEEEAKKLAMAVAVPAGIIGAYAGGVAGSIAGGNIVRIPIAGRLIGAGIGSIVSGGAAGAGAYVMTKNFFTGIRFDSSKLGERDLIVESAKPLIALELMGSNLLDNEDWDDKLKIYYQNEFEKTITMIMQKHGWITVSIEYV
jgi:hypothetical protein